MTHYSPAAAPGRRRPSAAAWLAAVLLLLTAVAGAAAAATPTAGPPVAASPGAAAGTACGPAPAGSARCLAVRLRAGTGRPVGLTPSQLHSAYKLPRSGGADQLVAVVIAGRYPTADADLAVYRHRFGLGACRAATDCLQLVDQRGDAGGPRRTDPAWAQEASLDLDVLSAGCRQCRLLLVQADSAAMSDLGAAVDTAVALGATVVNNSFGSLERTAFRSLAAHWDHPGVAIVAASGDTSYRVQFPSSAPTVTAVGGTVLTRAAGTSRGWRESAWSSTGTGCSTLFDRPSWQPAGPCTGRGVVDVAAVADPGFAIYDTSLPANKGWQEVGGTSAAAPVIAGAYALAGNAATVSGPQTAYEGTGRLWDVTSGQVARPCATLLCRAGQGYDGPTGLGTPDGISAF